MSPMSQECPHLALSPIYTSLSFSLHLYLVLLWEITFKDSDNPASSASSLHMKTTHPLLSCYILSVLLKLSSASSVTLPLSSAMKPKHLQLPTSQSPFCLLLWWCSVQNHHGSFWHGAFSCPKTITIAIPSSCSCHAGNRSHKLSSKVINRTGRLLSACVILCQ